MDSFYRSLPIYQDINEVFVAENYQAVPDEWFVVAADVRGSTSAIRQGRYKDVNFIGAANITSFLIHISSEVPFCFGGDGATLLIHRSMISQSEALLKSLCYWADECFDLELHAGIVSMTELRNKGADVWIAKYRLAHGMVQPMFTGGGLSLAEQIIKDDPSRRVLPEPVLDKMVIFEGLTCRWQPVPTAKGITLSLLISPLESGTKSLQTVVTKLEEILGGSLDQANPIRMRDARYLSFFSNLRRQIQISDFRLSKQFLAEIIELLLTVPLFNLRLFRFSKTMNNYVEQLPQHCDFQKFDDTLRMVLDCSAHEYNQIVQLLQYHADREQIVFGIHQSDAAQMTCYVQTVRDGGHLHFVDGHDGGYALAAVMLKEAMIRKTQTSE